MNYKNIAEEILSAVGKDNIISHAHCATRLRLVVTDHQKIDDDTVSEIEGVKGVFFNGGQYQIILGTGLVNKVYKELAILLGEPDNQPSNDNKNNKPKEKFSIKSAIRLLADIFVPIIPVIGATGLFLGLKGVIFNPAVLAFWGLTPDVIPPVFATIISVLTDTAFAFLPALICWSAFRNFGGMPIIGFVLGLMLVSPNLPNAYDVANQFSHVEALMAFGVIPIMGYQGSILTALISGILGAKLEIYLRRIMPNALDLIFTPFLVLLIMLLLSLLAFGPIIHIIESGLVALINKLITLPMGLGGLALGFIYPLAVLTGTHHIFILIETTLLANTGFNPIIALCAMYGFANGAICLAISVKTKKKSLKTLGYSSTATQLLGVSEPALFGVILRYDIKAFYLLLAMSSLGGALISLLGVQANSYGLAVLLSPLMYIYNFSQLVSYLAVSAFIFVLSFVLAYFIMPKDIGLK